MAVYVIYGFRKMSHYQVATMLLLLATMIMSSVAFCGFQVIMSNYDETYDVIYEVIMRKFRATMETF